MRRPLTPIIIDGWWGSGKSTLRGLLDGHPQLFVCPIQESFFGGISSDPNYGIWTTEKDVANFRKSLYGRTDYARIERDSLSTKIVTIPSGADLQHVPFTFDFYQFDRHFTKNVLKLERWTVEAIAETLYTTMALNWNQYPGDRNEFAGYVAMDNNFTNTVDLVLNETGSGKFIWVDRSSEGILATHTKRRPIAGSVGTANWGQKAVPDFIHEHEIERIERKRMKIESLAEQYPNRVLLIPFEELVNKTSIIASQVASFLGIANLPILNQFTYCGTTFPGSEAYLGKTNDSPESVFCPADLDAIRREVRRVRTSRGSNSSATGQLRRAFRHAVTKTQAYFR